MKVTRRAQPEEVGEVKRVGVPIGQWIQTEATLHCLEK